MSGFSREFISPSKKQLHAVNQEIANKVEKRVEENIYTLCLAPVGLKPYKVKTTDSWFVAEKWFNDLKQKCYKQRNICVLELWVNGFLYDRIVTTKFYRIYVESFPGSKEQLFDCKGKRAGYYWFNRMLRTGLMVNLYYFNGRSLMRVARKQDIELGRRYSDRKNTKLIVLPKHELILSRSEDWFKL